MMQITGDKQSDFKQNNCSIYRESILSIVWNKLQITKLECLEMCQYTKSITVPATKQINVYALHI